ncbi:uncharacterized protein LOC5515470 isoform X1 [Nematostella vectensis]|uniref:uncharacterized protein LOC5515470 isoform X1 n=1 Tax=Nematostella vectensis TaxID=45351 RepID=UPI002076DF2B|nr:uncharacterized protein LOC5515470 isoform X1 [Nematostella vectensis]
MGFPSTWRWALFICGLVLNQQMITATHLYHDHVTMTRALRRYQDREELENDQFDDEEMASYRNSTSGVSRHAKAQKRFFFLALFIVSLVVTVVTTVVETVHDIAGCCGLSFKDLCNFEKRFDNRKKAVTDQSKELDKKIQEGLDEKNALEKLGDALQTTWNEIERIVTLQREILKAVNPRVYVALKNRIDDIKNKNKLELMSISDIDKKLSPLEQGLKQSISWGMGVAAPMVGKLASSALKHVKIGKIYKSLKAPKASSIFNAGTKAQKMMGFSDETAKGFLKATAKARFAATGSKAMKLMKLMKGAGAVMSIVSIGMDMYSMISTLVECGRKEGKARAAMGEVKKAEDDVTKNERKFQEFKTELRTFETKTLLPQVRNVEFKNALDGVKSVIGCLDRTVKRDWDVSGCLQKFDIVKNTLDESSGHKVITAKLNDLTSSCLKKLKYTLECKLNKVKMIKHVEDGCMEGEKTFDELFQDAALLYNANSEKCTNIRGEPYTTKAELKRLIERSAAMKSYDADCRKNGQTLPNELSKRKRIEICELRGYGETNEYIAKYLRVPVEKVRQVMCPPE